MKLKDCSNTEIKQLLGRIVKLIGFNPENVKADDLEFISINLKDDFTINGLTIQQVDYAFKLASQGLLPDVKLESNKRLSPLYISNVLLPYKRSSYYQKSKETKRLELNKKVEWTYSMKKNHYEWLLNSVFLEESERNGVRGEFPDIVVASWKDIYDYMLIEEMIEALKGEYLKERLREIQSKENIMIRDRRRKVSYDNIIKTNKGNLPSAFYRHEVIDWFNKYRDQLMF